MLHSKVQLLLCLTGSVSGLSVARPESCKAYPGTSSWPSPRVWTALNQTLNGRLLRPPPPGAVCHPGQPTYDAALCPQVAQNWTTDLFHATNPISVLWDQYTNFTCLPEANVTCSSAGYPAFVVNASSAEDVKAGIDFARKYNIRLNVKNTGHDYLGRSNSPGSLSIWTHHLKNITYNEGQYKLKGSGRVIQGNSITAGGGDEMYDLYVAADKYGEVVVGGGGKTVGMGGFITGGGHSAFSPKYGLAVDNVLEIEMVTPGGDIVTVNEDCHSDLFWAMRGGGGSTFGVMTSVTMKTYPSPKIQGVEYVLATDINDPIVYDVITYFNSQTPSIIGQGISGYNTVTNDTENPGIPGMPDRIAGILGATLFQNGSPEDVAKIFNPINATIQERWGGKVQFYTFLTPYDTWLDWYEVNFDPSPAGGAEYGVSRLLDGEALTGDPDKLKSALQAAIAPSGSFYQFMIGGKGLFEAKPRGGSNAVTPAWRTTFVHTVAAYQFPAFDKAAENTVIENCYKGWQPLRDLTPGGGAYLNEAFKLEKNFEQTFWGSNYARLLQIKRQVDPTDVFWCDPCVGNDRWEVHQDGKLCKK